MGAYKPFPQTFKERPRNRKDGYREVLRLGFRIMIMGLVRSISVDPMFVFSVAYPKKHLMIALSNTLIIVC